MRPRRATRFNIGCSRVRSTRATISMPIRGKEPRSALFRRPQSGRTDLRLDTAEITF